ncbi:MAG TPA: hypothetical protein PLW78_12850 [bacterium]|nr:hypothetical protein [bacterium]HPM48050.1 hypothetical protein [bacterium]HRQ71180.1 hypothetical protein [bacterium]
MRNLSIFTFFLLFLFQTSCGLSTSDSNVDNDTVIADIDGDSDIDIETEENEFETEKNESETDENNFDKNAYIEPRFIFDIFFESAPHGITRWDEKFIYHIKCSSAQGLETSLKVSSEDTCGGTVSSNIYSFAPVKEKFPEKKCNLSVTCYNKKDSRTQTTVLLIPNPDILMPELNNNGHEFNFVSSSAEKDQFTITKVPPQNDYVTPSEINVYEYYKNSKKIEPLSKISALKAKVLYSGKETALIFTDYYVFLYDIKTQTKTELAYNPGTHETVQTGPMQTATIYYPGIVSFNKTIGNVTFFGVSSGIDWYSLSTTDGTQEGTSGHELVVSSIVRYGNTLDAVTKILADKYGGFYFNDTYYYHYVENSGTPSFKTDAFLPDTAGFDGERMYYEKQLGNRNKLVSLKKGKSDLEYIAPDYRSVNDGHIVNGNLIIIEQGEEGYISMFKNCDIAKEPVRLKIFDNYTYKWTRVEAIGNNYAVISCFRKNENITDLYKVVFDSNRLISISGPMGYIHNIDPTERLENAFLVDKFFVYEKDDSLFSIDSNAIDYYPVKLETIATTKDITDLSFNFLGKDISNEAVISYYKPDDDKKYIAKTDGTKDNYKKIEYPSYTDVNVWNEFILENNSHFIIEESGELVRKQICNESFFNTHQYKTDKAIYFIDKTDERSQKFFIFRMPETVLK